MKIIPFKGSLPHKHKVVIAGNHEVSFDDTMVGDHFASRGFGIDAEEVRVTIKYFSTVYIRIN